MQHHQLLIFFALLIFTFGLFSRIAERNSITGPMFFMTIGILASPLAFGFISASPDVGAVRLVAELALALVLFIDASMIDKTVGGYNFCRLAASSGSIPKSAVPNRLS